jgi:predicted ATP-grasp superfamily ATP-dependent carboligase
MIGRKIRVLIADGGHVLALPVARCLAMTGEVEAWLMLDHNPSPAWRTRHKAGFIKMGSGAFAEEVLSAARQMRADVALAVSEDYILDLARNKEVLEKHVRVALVPHVACMNTARNKTMLASFAARVGIPIPRTFIFNPADRVAFSPVGLRFPVLTKPALGGGGLGIELFDSPTGLMRFLDGPGSHSPCVVQEFIRGTDVDCSVICREGKILAYTIQRSLLPGSRPFMASGGVEFVHDAAVLAVVEQTMKNLAFDGVAHCDLRYDEEAGDVKLIEINPRFWGTLAASQRAGINFAAIMVSMAMGLPVPKTDYRDGRHYSSAVILKAALRSPKLFWTLPGFWRNSDMGLRLRDPRPELATLWQSLAAHWG